MATTPQQPPPKPSSTYTKPDDDEIKSVGQTQHEQSRKDEEERGKTVASKGQDRPGTAKTPPEGHTTMNPAPGEPGGPTAGHYPSEADAPAPSKR